MSWKIAEVTLHFGDVVRRASHEPQIIVNQEKPVAAVIGAEDLEAFLAWRAAQQKRPLADALAEATRICAEEDIALEPPQRADRRNPLLPRAKRVSGRYQRRQ